MPVLICSIFTLVLFAIELLYFRIAERCGIVDNPNNRSSHTGRVIRGGGIVFVIALLCWFFYAQFQWPFFVLGATLVAFISFADDITPQRTVVRMSIHLVAVLLLFYQIPVYHWQWLLILMAVIVCIGTINAFNFMDGINGMTGIYALVNLSTFLYIHEFVVPFSDTQLITMTGISVLTFLFFNFRKKARCFAGDVGSISLAYIQIFLLLQLILATTNYYWVILFLVYGIDSTITIIHRLLRRENIFRAHRTHVYQYLSNELGWSHRMVSLLYGATQLVLNIILVVFLQQSVFMPLLAAFLFVIFYLIVRIKVISIVNDRPVGN